MLQQTTVGAVRRRYPAFLSRFPDLATLARAREESVLAAWSGLGYYARARNLHRAARQILRRHGGRLPDDPALLRGLPGFGEYMAAAVASLAFGARLPAVDANVARTLSRLFAVPGVLGTRPHASAVRGRAVALLSRGDSASVTAALMDLGQLVCTARDPRCPRCPLAALCAARRLGRPTAFPRRRPAPRLESVFVAAACAVRGGRALLVQRPEALLRGLWQFPSAEGGTRAAAAAGLRRALRPYGLVPDAGVLPVATRHTIVHRRLRIAVYHAVPARRPQAESRNPGPARWFSADRLASAAIPTLTRKIAAAAGFLSPGERRIPAEDESRKVLRSDRGSHERGGRRPGHRAISDA